MVVVLKEVKACKNKAAGNFLMRGREKAVITISMKVNDTLAEYSATVLHELLHLWTTVIRRKGFKCTDSKEHKYIYLAEELVIKAMQNVLKEKK